MSGRTIWLAKDADWWTREWVVDLGEEHGPVGPAVLDWLECAAKRQNNGGRVKAGMKSLARGVFSDAVTVSHVVSRAVTLCLLLDFSDDSGLFKCRIAWWEADQERALAASRQARRRAENIEDSSPLSRSVTPSHALSRSVTNTGQESTEEERAKALSSARPILAESEKATDSDRECCRLFYSLGRQRNPKLKVPRAGSKDQSNALRSMRLLREQDSQTPADIERLIEWIYSDPSDDAMFWGTTIQAPSGLRKHFSAAWSKMVAPAGTRNSNGQKLSAVAALHQKLNEAEAAQKAAL